MSTVAGLDLHVELSPTRPARSLETALRDAVIDGRLPPDTRLPAARSLATDIGVSRNTVAAVYAQLTAEGWLEARVGAGTWVVGHVPGGDQASARRPTTSPRLIDMRGGIPDPTGFPRREWIAAVRSAVLEAPAADLGYGDPAGTPRLRAALAAYVGRARGVIGRPEGIMVGQGFGELLVLVCRALRGRGAIRMAVEEYGHDSHRRLIASTGLDVVPIPVDGDGAVVTALDGVDVAAALLTPAHQFPIGTPLSAARRRWLSAWAQRTGALIIEDDYDGEFRYDRRSIGALQALAPSRVAYLGTASKALAPAVGLAWAAFPGDLLPDVLEQRELAGARPAALQQLAFAAFLDGHEYDRSVRRLRSQYRDRRARLEAVVTDELPGCALTGEAAGLQCLLRLPSGAEERRVAAEARRRGLLLQGLHAYRAQGMRDRPSHPALVVGYGGPTPGQYDTALSLLVESIHAGA